MTGPRRATSTPTIAPTTVTVTIAEPAPTTVAVNAGPAPAALDAGAPAWVMLPGPPVRRQIAKQHVAALRRRGLKAAMRPHPDSSTAWAIWALTDQVPAAALSLDPTGASRATPAPKDDQR